MCAHQKFNSLPASRAKLDGGERYTDNVKVGGSPLVAVRPRAGPLNHAIA